MATVKKDQSRFKKKIRENVKKNIKNIINGEFQSVKGGKSVKVPIDSIHIPRIRYTVENEGGVGRGEGEEGEVLGIDEGDGEGQQQAGNEKGQHSVYADISLEEAAEILGEELHLPNIVPKGQKVIEGEKDKYNTVSDSGPRSLRHKKRTLKNTIKRGRPDLVPYVNDFKYKSWTRRPSPMNNAVVFYMQDISASMSREQLVLVRTICFWIEAWLSKEYDNVDIRYIMHDTIAGEVTQEQFYAYSPGGGTMISTAFQKMLERIKLSYPVDDWNIYPFYFGDGDNWGEDSDIAIKMVTEDLVPICNQLSIGIIESAWQSVGNFGTQLQEKMQHDEELAKKLSITTIQSINGVYDAIKEFLGKGN